MSVSDIRESKRCALNVHVQAHADTRRHTQEHTGTRRHTQEHTGTRRHTQAERRVHIQTRRCRSRSRVPRRRRPPHPPPTPVLLTAVQGRDPDQGSGL